MLKKSVITYILVFFISAFFSAVWAQTDEENLSENECVPQAQIDAMSDDNIEKLELPVCDEGENEGKSEGESEIESNDSSTQDELTENEVITDTTEVMVEESSFPSPDEKLYGD